MGHLFYGTSTEPIRIPDRLLSHLKVVMTTKLRRSESFTLSWTHVDGTPGRSTLWLQPAIPFRFVFDSAEPESLDATTLKNMADMANSSAGLIVDLQAEIPTAATRTAPSRSVAPERGRSLPVAA
ncbi:von Willebrand factor A [Microbacterium sp. SUBG005]|nr:von Willebrand factor A [Microbacterium sp. SUBG005]